MERKRSCGVDSSYVYKRTRQQVESEDTWSSDDKILAKLVDLPSDTLAAILYLKSIFPQKLFQGLVPPIVLKHQIYCVIKDKTLVDRQLNKLWNERKVHMFKLITGCDELAIVLAEDFVTHVRSKVKQDDSDLLDDFLRKILPECIDVSISKQALVNKHHYKDNQITTLVNNGLLQCRDVDSWWLGIPGAGSFMKHLTKGRQTILRKIKRRKFKEILLHDLEKTKIPSKLGTIYHIYDITGAELVKRTPSTSGDILKLATKQ